MRLTSKFSDIALLAVGVSPHVNPTKRQGSGEREKETVLMEAALGLTAWSPLWPLFYPELYFIALKKPQKILRLHA